MAYNYLFGALCHFFCCTFCYSFKAFVNSTIICSLVVVLNLLVAAKDWKQIFLSCTRVQCTLWTSFILCWCTMLNSSSDLWPLWTLRPSQRLLQQLWDYLLLHHRPLISSPFFPVILAFSSYVCFSLPFTVLDLLGDRAPFFYQYKIQQDRKPTLQMMKRSIMTALYNHIFFVLPAVIFGIFILPPPALPAEAPTVYEFFVNGLAALLLFDTQYYIWHFIHHKNPQLYKWVHAIHHEYMSPFSWSTEQLSIPELMTVGFWSNLDPILLRCHPLTTWCVTVFSIWMSVEDHIGYDLPWTLNRLVPGGLLGGAPAHDMHHQKPNSNYAPFFSHWDRIFGTAAPLKRTFVK